VKCCSRKYPWCLKDISLIYSPFLHEIPVLLDTFFLSPWRISNDLPWVMYGCNLLEKHNNCMCANLDLITYPVMGGLFFLTGPFIGCALVLRSL